MAERDVSLASLTVGCEPRGHLFDLTNEFVIRRQKLTRFAQEVGKLDHRPFELTSAKPEASHAQPEVENVSRVPSSEVLVTPYNGLEFT